MLRLKWGSTRRQNSSQELRTLCHLGNTGQDLLTLGSPLQCSCKVLPGFFHDWLFNHKDLCDAKNSGSEVNPNWSLAEPQGQEARMKEKKVSLTRARDLDAKTNFVYSCQSILTMILAWVLLRRAGWFWVHGVLLARTSEVLGGQLCILPLYLDF